MAESEGEMETKSYLIYGGVIIAIAIGIIWIKKRAATSAQNSEQNAISDNQLFGLMSAQPSTTSQVQTSAPVVDTGNAQMQQLIDSLLKPSSNQNNTTSNNESNTSSYSGITPVLSGIPNIPRGPDVTNSFVPVTLPVTTQPGMLITPNILQTGIV